MYIDIVNKEDEWCSVAKLTLTGAGEPLIRKRIMGPHSHPPINLMSPPSRPISGPDSPFYKRIMPNVSTASSSSVSCAKTGGLLTEGSLPFANVKLTAR
jgi:hypothetical protein